MLTPALLLLVAVASLPSFVTMLLLVVAPLALLVFLLIALALLAFLLIAVTTGA